MRTIYNKVKRAAMLALFGAALAPTMQAQDALHLFYKSKQHDVKVITEDTKVEFVKQPYLNAYWVGMSSDTIYLAASSGRSNGLGYVDYNVGYTLSTDSEWLLPRKGNSPQVLSDGIKNDYFIVFAAVNDSDQPRYGKVTVASERGGLSRDFVVMQQPYMLTLTSDHLREPYAEAVTEMDAVLAWNDTTYYAVVYPNRDVALVSHPDWMEMVYRMDGDKYCQFEDMMKAESPQSAGGAHETYVRFRFTENRTPENRTGEIVFEAHGQRAVIGVTQEGLTGSTALSSLKELQKCMHQALAVSTNHDDFSHMSVLHATDMLTEDMTMFNASSFFNYDYAHDNNAANYRRNVVNWETYYGLVKRANATIGLVEDIKDLIDNEDFVLGNALAYRAMSYLYLIQLFQDPTREAGVNKLLPGVPMLFSETEMAGMTAEEVGYFKGRNTVGEVFEQIESDITRAITLLQGLKRPTKDYIDMTVAQGIAARYYLLVQDWEKAATMANAARNSYRLMDGNTEVNGIRDGFMDITNEEWMWGFDHTEETMTMYASFFSHVSNLTDGYSGIGYTGRGVDARLYSQMSATDYRRNYWYRDANGYTESTAAASPNAIMWKYPYAMLKFGWKEDWTQDYIYMRAAEMLLIEAEAQMWMGNSDQAAGLLGELMSRRDPEWQQTGISLEDIYLQRRLELIGEGHAYFDLKRLNRGIDRNYEGSNHLENYKVAVGGADSAWVYKIPQRAINDKVTYNLTEEDNLWTVPVYLNEINYSNYYVGDTIFMSASAGRAYTYGRVEANVPWTVTTDADWLLARINESDIYDGAFSGEHTYENIFMVYATANETNEERVAHVTIDAGKNVKKTLTVVQHPYTLTFNESSFTNVGRYDGEPVDTFVIDGTWDWTTIYYNIFPNHGWEITSCPDWLTVEDFVHGSEKCSFDAILAEEDILAAGQPIVSTVVFVFEPNESAEARTAYITFEGHGQKIVGVFNQEGLSEETLLNSAKSLVKNLYAFNIAETDGHDDYGFPSLMLGMDSRGIDMVSISSNYNWYNMQLGYSDLNSNYRATAVYWNTLYKNINYANEVIRAYGERDDQSLFQFYLAQAYTLRAFNYFYLAQIYQQTYVGNEDELCVPLILDTNMDIANTKGLPRATVREVYNAILADLDTALGLLQQTEFVRPAKNFVSAEVVYGLRARVNMVRGEWQAAAEDAQHVIAAQGVSPYTKDEVARTTFADINHSSWVWGIDTEETDGVAIGVANWPSHIGSFNTGGYASMGTWRMVNKTLFESIPSSDVRKGWFLNENKTSANLSEEQAVYVSSYNMPAYTQVKFAPYAGLERTPFAQDIPLLRVEEMYLILAEAQAMSGNVDAALNTLNTFVSTYRDQEYNCTATTAEELQEAVWMQRRIELWGEGHSYFDLMRMKKGVDRRGAGFPRNFVYNIPAGDAALIYPIPDAAMNSNPMLIQNPVAELPSVVDDYVPFKFYGTGIYTSELFGGSWYQDMEISTTTADLYRLPDCIVSGYDLNFTWDEETGDVVVVNTTWETGYVHPEYGMLYATCRQTDYNAETRTFTFVIEYWVEAGAFGTYADTFVLLEQGASARRSNAESFADELPTLVDVKSIQEVNLLLKETDIIAK